MNKYSVTSLIAAACFYSVPAYATVYVPPKPRYTVNISSVMLDPSRMSSLSQHLTTIASRQHDPMNARDVQCNAKLLHLAFILDQQNGTAISLNSAYKSNIEVQFKDSQEINNSLRKVSEITDFLLRKAPSKANKQLAGMILDCISVVDPKARILSYRKAESELWNGFIADIKEFEKPGQRPITSATIPDNGGASSGGNSSNQLPSFHRKLAEIEGAIFNLPLFD